VAKVHGHLSAGDAGELVGVTGNTIGQWARWGYIRASQSSGDPHVYSVEDVAEAAVVRALLERHVRHTGSLRAEELLARWSEAVTEFARIIPTARAAADEEPELSSAAG